MRLASLALIPLFIFLACPHIAQCDEDYEQQLAAVAHASNYTVQLGSFISTRDLPAGEALQIAYISTRLCGKGFVSLSGQVNRSLLQDVTELTNFNTTSYYLFDVTKAATAAPAPVTYIQGTATESSLQTSGLNFSSYQCVDLQLVLSAFRSAYFVDFGVSDLLWSLYVKQRLQLEGWDVVGQATTNLVVTSAAAPYLKQLGDKLAPSSAYNFTLQVYSSIKLCCTDVEQSLVLSVLDDVLANATNLITLRINNVTSLDLGVVANYANSANFSFTASVSNYAPVPSLSTALNAVLSNGTDSLFSQQMANRSVAATASPSDLQPFPGDSFSDQVFAYDGASSTHLDKLPVALPVGVALGGALVLAATATLGFYIYRQRRQNKLQKAKLAEAAQAKAEYHQGSNSTVTSSSPELTSIPVDGQWSPADGVAAQPWDLDPAEITVCKRPDGSDWILGIGSFGQVVKGLRGGVQDVALKMLLGETHYQVNSFRQEIEILKSLSFDRSIVQFYGTCPWQGKTMLVLEHMEGGDLRQAMTKAPAELHWYNKGALVALDIIKGLHFLHKHKVVHMDMKPKNVLLTADYSIAKIADVGLAHIMGGSTPGSQAMGTFAYAAPEQLLNQPCDEKVDIYSFGVLLWELVTATPPIRGRLRPIKAPAECPQGIADLVECCLSMDPHSRPSARDVFDVISKVQGALDKQAAQDPWDANEGPPPFVQQQVVPVSV